MLQRWNLLGRLDPNFHIVMPGDPPTLFPLSRCGLAGTISYGSLDVIVNIKDLLRSLRASAELNDRLH